MQDEELIAMAAAAIAEENNVDIKKIRIISVKEIASNQEEVGR
jgi:hypothetical protein